MNTHDDASPAQNLADLAGRMIEVLLQIPGVPQDPNAPWAVLNAYGISSVIAAATRPSLKASAPPGVLADLDRIIVEAAAILRKRLDADVPAA